MRNEKASRPHVQIFGAEVNAQNSDGWKDRREEWRKVRQERREEWKKMYRDGNGYRHCHCHRHGGIFWGLFIFFLGVVLFLSTLRLIPVGFWHAILPFWPILLILWGLDIILGRSGPSRFIITFFALIFFLAIVIYGLAKTASPLANNLPPNVVSAAGNINPQNPLYQ